jgi:hypothetical protein
MHDGCSRSRHLLVTLAGPSSPEFVITLDTEFVQYSSCLMDL